MPWRKTKRTFVVEWDEEDQDCNGPYLFKVRRYTDSFYEATKMAEEHQGSVRENAEWSLTE